MATLVSPGISISVTNEGVAPVTGAGTVPLFFITTQANKTLPDGSGGIAPGTLSSNVGSVYTITSQRELLQTFGNPYFQIVDGTVQQGSEVNEYGLHAAYSYLGLANSAIVVRGDIDTAQLLPTETVPTSLPSNGTYWFDYTDTSFGVFRANGNSTSGLAWDSLTVKVPTLAQVSSSPTYAPLNSYGSSGDIAVSVWNSNNALYEKIGTVWYQIGTSSWESARQTVVTGTVGFSGSSTLGYDGNLVIDGITIALTSTMILSDVIAAITGVPNVTSSSVVIGAGPANNFLQLTDSTGEDIVIGAGSTAAVLTALGLSEITYPGYHFVYAPHTSVPTGTHAGDIWVKTTSPNFGSNYVVKLFSSSINQFQTVSAPFYVDDITAEISGGVRIGNVYVEYNTTGTVSAPIATQVIKRMSSTSSVSATSTTYAAPGAGSFTIRTRGSAGAGVNVDTTITVSTSGSESVSQVENLINVAVATNGTIPHIVATVLGSNLVISSTNGTAFKLTDGSGTPLATITMPVGVFSNWSVLVYEASATAPTTVAADGTLWFNPALTVDIMVNDGNQWLGYRNYYPATDPLGVQITSAEPTAQTNGNPLVDNDLWIDSSNVVNYPALHRYSTTTSGWILIDNTDHTTPMGIVFGDARQDSGPSGAWLESRTSPLTGTAQPVSTLSEDLLHSDFVDPVDLQILNPQIFPTGIMLFNTEIGTDNVKQRNNKKFANQGDYTVGVFLDNDYEVANPGSRAAVEAYLADSPGRWDTFSGNDFNDVAYMGTFAQRICVVRSMAAQIVGNETIRAETLFYNLIAAPGYVELFSDLVTLNVDRNETAFIVTDVPSSLTPDATSINNWATNTANVTGDGRLGRVTLYDYAAMYYPWALGTNVDGYQVAIPSSSVALRTYGYNDRVAYPWYAPAGTRRGVISNASSVGYVDIQTHEYTPVTLNQGQRDTLYTNNINPLAFIPGQGLLVYGQKTLTGTQTNLTSRVNVARLVVYLRWIVPQLVQSFLFELNTTALQASAADVVGKFLTGLLGLNAITDFVVVCDSSNNTPETIAAHQLWISIAIVPTEAVEFIYIPIALMTSIQ